MVDLNCAAVDEGVNALRQVTIPESWLTATDDAAAAPVKHDFVNDLIIPMNQMQGDKLPVSLFKSMALWTAPGPVVPPSTISVLMRYFCPSGMRRSASSATSVPQYVLTRLSARTC